MYLFIKKITWRIKYSDINYYYNNNVSCKKSIQIISKPVYKKKQQQLFKKCILLSLRVNVYISKQNIVYNVCVLCLSCEV